MLTIEVNGQFITWSEDFANFMMKYYQKHGVDFILHRNCVQTGLDNTAKDNRTAESLVPCEAYEYSS